MPPEFNQETKDALAKRAALRCSNPDCDKITAGPNSELAKATSIGEAAHIYGAKPGAARYREEMADSERAMITNAIWLCRDCHALIDKDQHRFPADLLFLWKDEHEAKILHELGKPGELMRFKIEQKSMKEFEELPIFIKHIIKYKTEYWEYNLTVELLDYYIGSAIRKARNLELRLYSKSLKILTFEDFQIFFKSVTSELSDNVEAIENIFAEFQAAWGEPGYSGDVHKIVNACQLYGSCADRFVVIAEEAMFSRSPEGFEGVTKTIGDAALHLVKKLTELPKHLRSVLSFESPQGEYPFNLELDLPEGFTAKILEHFDAGIKVQTSKTNRTY